MSENEVKNIEQDLEFLQTTNEDLRRSLNELTILQEMLKVISGERTLEGIVTRFTDIIKKKFTYKGYIFFEITEKGKINPHFSEKKSRQQLLAEFSALGLNTGW